MFERLLTGMKTSCKMNKSLVLVVRDNILDDPDEYVKISKRQTYWSKETHPDDIGYLLSAVEKSKRENGDGLDAIINK